MSAMRNSVAAFLAVVIFVGSCAADTQTDPNALKILPVGDSRAQGARPAFESYRYPLWKQLVASGQSFDFVGPLEDAQRYASFQGQRFDRDHAGVGGFTTGDILDNIDDALEEIASPDVVLLGIGGNDLLGDVPQSQIFANLTEIVATLRQSNPEVTIIMEQIAPGLSNFMTGQRQVAFDQFNARVLVFAGQQSTIASPIIVVDMAQGWSDAWMADDVHYNQAGADEVARRYFQALSGL